MAKQFKVLVNTGKDQDTQTHLTEQGAGQRGRPLILKAQAGAKYQLVESSKRNNLAPDNVKAKRVGKNLHLMFETSAEADVIIEDYYSAIGDSYNGVVGKAENGRFYEYLTEDPTDPGLIPLLSDNMTAVTQALGGAEVSGAGAAIAVVGLSPLWGVLGLAGLGAAAFLGRDKGTGTNTPSPVGPTAELDTISDTGVNKTDKKTNDSTPVISGKATPGATVEVTINGQTYTTTADSNGNYAVTVPATDKLPDGVYTPVVTVTSGGQSTSFSATPFTIDTTASINIETAGSAGTLKPISGVTDPGSTVVVKDSAGRTIGTATAGLDGRWTVTPTSAVPAGTITATATDPAGNIASDKGSNNIVSPLTPAITSVFDDVSATTGVVQKYSGQPGDIAQGNTNDTRPTLNGTGVPGSMLYVYDTTTGGTPKVIGSTTVDTTGKWSYTPTTALISGEHKFSVGTTATAPTTGDYPVNIDTSAPAKPVNDPTGTNDNNGTGTGNTFSVIDNVGATQGNVAPNATIDDTTPVINGKGNPGDLVKIYDNGVLIGSATVGTNGLWNFKPSTPLSQGSHPISTEFVDPSGNTSGKSNPLTFTIDSSKTPVSIVDVNDNVAPQAGLIQPNGQTNDPTPTLDGKGTPGTVVTIMDGDIPLGSTTVLSDGTWSFTPTEPLSDGPHNFTATAPDSTGAPTTTGVFPLTVDTTAPAAPSIASATDDVGGRQGNNPTSTLTDDATPTLNGKAEPGSTVTIKDATGNIVGTAKADPDGNWNLTLPALPADGTYTYTASTTDPAGNISPDSAPFSVILDTKADTTPPTIAISRNSSGTLTSSETITFTLSEASTTFAASDIDVTNGSLSNFTPLPTSGTPGSGYTVYTATFTPKAGSTGTATIGVASDKFSDNAGNLNKDTYASAVTGTTQEANNQVSITFNTTATAVDVTTPNVIVARGGTGTLAAGNSETITFTLSEASTTFTAADVDVSGGTLTGFTPVATSGTATSGYNQYVATFTPNAGTSGTATIGVASSKFTDAAGLLNKDTYATGVTGTTQEANNQIGISYNTTVADTTAPTIAITRSGTGTLTSSETVYFTLSEASNTFALEDIDVAGGTLSNLTPVASTGTGASGFTQYTATFTPTAGTNGKATISVASSKFSDATGNLNKDTYLTGVTGTTVEANNQLGLIFDTTLADTTTPTIAITSDKVNLQPGEAATITFTLSEGSTDFTAEDITVTGGTLTDFIQSDNDPKVYTATFTPAASAKATISVASGKFSDTAGNSNTDGAEVNNSVSLVLSPITGALAPVSDTGTQGDNKTSDTTPTIAGKAAPGSTVEVTLNGKTYTTTASPTGDYTVTVPDSDKLPDGVYTPLIKATSPTGVTTTLNGTPITVDTVTQVNIENPGVAGTSKPLSGTAEPGDIVVVKDKDGNTVGSATTGPDGRWTLNPNAPVPAGTITATATDPAGNTASDSGNNAAAAPVAPAITSVTDDQAGITGLVQKFVTGATGDIGQGNTNDTTPTINGTGAPGSVITVFDNTTGTPVVLGSTTVDADGQWSFTPTTALSSGVHKFSAGVSSTPSTGDYPINIDNTAPAKPALDPTNTDANTGTGTGNTLSVIDNVGPTQGLVPTNGTTDDNTPVINGKGTPGDVVKIYDNGVPIGSTTVGPDGKWSFSPTTPLTDGPHSIATDVTDAAGNTSPKSDPVPFTVDTSKTPVGINSLTDNVAPVAGNVPENGSTNDSTPTLNGTGTPGTTVTIKDGNTPLGTAVVQSDGTWSFTPTTPLTDGPHSITATGPDSTGTPSTTAPFTIGVDTTPPAAPSITSATDDVGVSQGNNPSKTVTDDATPTLNGKAEAGSTITIKDDSGNVVGTTKADANGNWSLTVPALPADGTYTYKATATDAAGNVGPESAPFSVILDTQSDTTPPTIVVARSGTGALNGSTSTETITFTLSEASTTFALSDIDVKGGALSNFSPVPTSGTAGTGYTQYTATFVPTAGTSGTATIGVLSDRFTDNAGNPNKDTYSPSVTGTIQEANNQVAIAYNATGTDTAGPTITVTRAGTGTLAAGNTETISFVLSEASTSFTQSDIDVTGGTLSNFAPVAASGTTTGGFTQYTATFTPSVSSSGTATIGVASSKFTDAASNLNKDTYVTGVSGTTLESNNQVSIAFDTNAIDTNSPTIAITRSGTGTLTSSETIYFTLSEASTTFDISDIDVTGGTLTAFAPVATTGTSTSGFTQYTATFTPTGNATGKATIGVDAAKFADTAGNFNKDTYQTGTSTTTQEANNQIGINFDTTTTTDSVVPTIAVTSDKTEVILGQNANITFTLSEDSSDFTLSDVAVSGGTLSNLQGSGKVYTATFTPGSSTNVSGIISVASGKFSDAAGNFNTDGAEINNTVSLTIRPVAVDTTPPTVAISRNGTGTLTSSETITFTLSEASTSFAQSDIDVTGGTLSNFTPVPTTGTAGTGYTQYTATFTPTGASSGTATIGVTSDKFSDNAGNANKDTYLTGVTGTTVETNNQISISFNTSGNPTPDNIAPTVIVARAGTGTLATGNTETISFTLSETSKDFTVTDIDVTGGTLSGFAPVVTSGNASTGYAQYTAVFTPTASSNGTATIGVASSKFVDAAGNLNKDTYLAGVTGATQEANNQVSIAFDTTKADSTPPTVAVTRAGTGTVSNSETIYFTLSEASTTFDINDIDVTGGTLSAFAAVATTGTSTSGFTQYTATFTPTANSSGNAVIGVASDKFTDAASNLNKDTYISGVSGATQEANNQVVLNFDTTGARDTVAPTIAITSDKTALTSGDTATITFTLSENSTDFTNADIGVSGGTLSNFQGSGKVYTATFTPNLNSTANGIVSVASSKFSDAAGNLNADGSETNNTVTMSTNTIDKVPPTIAITSDKTSLIAGETATITFTLSEESADFVATDVTVNGGAIGALTRSSSDPKVYTATFTPTAGVIANSVISVASNKFSDAAGNYNVDGSETNNSISLPTNTIPGDTTPPTIAISRNGTGTLTSSETITFTLSEASDDFSIGDIDVNGGTLSNFSPVPTTGTAGTGYTQYTATFTPSSGTKGNATIGVASAKFADPAGNNNQDTYVANVSGTTQEANNQVSIAFDTSGNPTADTTTPTIIVARAGTGTLATGNTETILFTLSEASTDFIASDIDVTGGTLSAFAPVATSGNATTGYAQYTAVFTPTANNTGTATIGVASSKFADAAGNLNKDTYLTAALGNTQEANNQVSIAFDTTKADTTPPTAAP